MRTKYNQSFTLSSHFIALLALAAAMMVADVSLAQTDITWNNAAARAWNSTANWSPATIPNATSHNAVFGTVGCNLSSSDTINGTSYSMEYISLNEAHSIGQLHFRDKVSTYNGWHIYDSTGTHTLTVSGNNGANPVILQDSGCTAAILAYSSGHEFNLALGKSGGNTIQVDGTVLEIQCPISGSGNSLTKTGVGTLVLDGTNTYSGGTTIANPGGTLKITNPGALGAGSVTIQKQGNNSGTLQLALTGTNTIANTFNGFAGTTFKDGAVACIQNVSGVNKITSDLTVTTTGGAGIVIQSDADSIELSGTIGSSLTSANRGLELTGAGNGLVSGLVQDGMGGYAFNLQKYGAGTWTLAHANTYSGDTTISGGTLKLDTGGTLANTANITVASGAGLDVSTPTTALTLGSGQTLKADATGANTTGTITVANNKNLTLGGTTIGLQFTAYGGGSTPPLTVTGSSAGSLALNSKPVTVYTTSQLAAGAYKLIAKSGSATVSGTPGTLSVTGRGVVSGATPTLQVVSGELYLYVPGISAAATLTGNISSTYGAPANPASVSVSGSGLSGNLTVTAQTGYQVCLTSGGSYTSSLTLTPSGGAVPAATVYVEFTSTEAAATYYSGINIGYTCGFKKGPQ